jgi:hypothetical protein
MSKKHQLQKMPAEDVTAMEGLPKIGDVYQCGTCGMEIEVVADCGCPDGPRLECCGRPMVRAEDAEPV